MPKKTRYYYDPETCTYQKERVTFKSVSKRLLIDGAIAIVLACGFYASYFYFYDDPKTASLKNTNASLMEQLNTYHGRVSKLELAVNDLHQKDNQFYRSMLSAEPINEGVWEGGKGGADNFQFSEHPSVLKETEKKIDQLNHKIQLQSNSFDYLKKLFAQNEVKLQHIPAIRPVAGGVISGFGMRRHPIHKIHKMHTGLDFEAQKGTPIIATGDGVIKTAGVTEGGYGIQIEIDHGYGYITKYAHLSVLKVNHGQKVKRGDVIAYSGNTGLSSGPHLHYEILRNGSKIDPIDYFYRDLSPQQYAKLRKEAQAAQVSMD